MFDGTSPRGLRQAEVTLTSAPTGTVGNPQIPHKLVLALGNTLRGDDGLGIAVLEALSSSPDLPEGVRLADCSTGGLINELLNQDYTHVIIVDAALMGYPPGTWKRFTLRDVDLASTSLATYKTLHNIGLAETLALGDSLEITLPEIVIYGVQPLSTNWSSGLSEPVQKILPDICAVILNELQTSPKIIPSELQGYSRGGANQDI